MRSRVGKETASSDGGADTLISRDGVQYMSHAMAYRHCDIDLTVRFANDVIRKRRRFQAAFHIETFRLWALQTLELMGGRFKNDGESTIAERCARSTCGSTVRLNGVRNSCSMTLRS